MSGQHPESHDAARRKTELEVEALLFERDQAAELRLQLLRAEVARSKRPRWLEPTSITSFGSLLIAALALVLGEVRSARESAEARREQQAAEVAQARSAALTRRFELARVLWDPAIEDAAVLPMRQAALNEYVELVRELNDRSLAGANLARLTLRGDFSGWNLQGTNVRGANCSEIVLAGANLRRVEASAIDLSRADLRRADLTEADLSQARLVGALLRDASLTFADLSGADVAGSDFEAADLRSANLTAVEGLEAGQIERAVTDDSTSLPRGVAPPRDPEPRTPGAVVLYEGNGATQSVVHRTTAAPGQSFRPRQNDEARSLRLIGVRAGTVIKLYDDPRGNTGDDWCEIRVIEDVDQFVVPSFETNIDKKPVLVRWHEHNGLDGKVSLVTIESSK